MRDQGRTSDTTSEKGDQIREAVRGVWRCRRHAESDRRPAEFSFKHADLSLLASEETVDKKLGHKYKKVIEIEDDAAVPRIRYVSQDAISEGEYVLLTETRRCCGRLTPRPSIVASGGALAGALAGAALVGGDWRLLWNCSPGFPRASTIADPSEQLGRWRPAASGPLFELGARKQRDGDSAKHSGRDVHVHALPASV